MSELTNAAAESLPDEVRRDFDAWIDAEGLGDKWIMSGSFDTPGEIRAQVVARDDAGQPKLNDAGDEPVTEERVFPIVSPLPASVVPFLQ